jgi:hypothetical protein
MIKTRQSGNRAPSAQAETGLVELCLPAHLLALMAEQIARHGWELRADINAYLNRAAAVPLAGLGAVTIQRLARRVDQLARSLLHDLAPDNPQLGLLTCAMFTLTLVDDGLFPDPRNQAVLVSLLLVDEARDDDGRWRVLEAEAKTKAHGLLVRTRLQGYYLQRPGRHQGV